MSPAKNMPALPFFFDAYLVDTMHLKLAQHGAYFLLLGHAWRQGGYLPDDDEMLAAMTFQTLREWSAMKPVVMKFWTLSKKGWSQKRLMKELRYAAEARNKKRAAGKRGGEVTAEKHKGKEGSTAAATPQQNSSNAAAPIPIPTPNEKKDADAALFGRAEQVLGKGSGGMVVRLKQAKGGSIELARAAIETAATKHNAREYIGKIISKASEESGDPVRGSVGAI